MTRSSIILQVVPRAPGIHDAVGDYAFTLASKLREFYSRKTIFVAHELAHTANEFEILSPLVSVARNNFHENEFQHVILHYVNYGYQKRGGPFALLSILRAARRQCRGHFLTIFHELYSSGPPWKSAFWLRPFQVRIAKSVSQLSDGCIVSSETMLVHVQTLTPQTNVRVHPVPSNSGEPPLSPAATRTSYHHPASRTFPCQ